MKMKIFLIVFGVVFIAALVSVYILFAKKFIPGKLDADSTSKVKDINSPFGITGLYGEKDYELTNKMGISWIRPQIGWKLIEPKDDQFNWDKVDEIYKQNSKYGFNIMVSLRTGQLDWATTYDPSLCQYKKDAKAKGCPDPYASLPPKDLQSIKNSQYAYSKSYYDFVYNLVKHFKGRINYYIIENEVNTLTFWHGTPEQYLQLRATAYKAAHDANKDVVIIDNGIASGVWGYAIARDKYCLGDANGALEFLKLYFKRYYETFDVSKISDNPTDCENPGRAYQFAKAIFTEPTFDVLSYHFYEPWQAQEEVATWIKNEMSKNKIQRPIYNTEGGYFDKLTNQTDKNTQELVAEDVIKLHAVAFGEGVKKWIWLPLSEKTNSQENKYYKGLYNSSFKKLPSGVAYEVMLKKIDGFTDVEKLNLGQNIWAYKFTINQESVYVLWSTSKTTLDFSSKVSKNAKITKIDGKSSTVSSSNLPIDQSPIYVE